MARKLGRGKHADGGGLYLQVDDSGARRWILRVTMHGKRRELGIGSFPMIGLALAREQARELRRIAKAGGDPITERDKDKRRPVTFEEAAKTVHAEQIVPTSKGGKHVMDWLSSLERHAFNEIGSRPVHAITTAEIQKVLAPIWLTRPETARRVRQRMRTVFNWAYTCGHREGRNPVDEVEKGLPKQRERVRHFPALPWRELPDLMQRLASMDGMGALALRFAILTAARSGEVRGARWEEIDRKDAIWTIPGERMKGRETHRVPLTQDVMTILDTARQLAGRPDDLVFPSTRQGRPLSDMTLSAALKRAGVTPDRGTVHGMRSAFRDWSEEATSFPYEVKEAALAHQVKNEVERAYRRSDLFDKRRVMMSEWTEVLNSSNK